MMKRITGLSICLVLIFGVLAFLTGCNEKKAPAAESTVNKTAEKAEENATAMADEATEQTTCPVMKGPINTEYYTEYKGKKVYFCCPGCEEEFAKNPEKYIKELPQFN